MKTAFVGEFPRSMSDNRAKARVCEGCMLYPEQIVCLVAIPFPESAF